MTTSPVWGMPERGGGTKKPTLGWVGWVCWWRWLGGGARASPGWPGVQDAVVFGVIQRVRIDHASAATIGTWAFLMASVRSTRLGIP